MGMKQIGIREGRQDNKKSQWPAFFRYLCVQWSEAPGLYKQMLPKSLLCSQRIYW